MSVRFCAAPRRYGGMLWIAAVAVVLFAGLFMQITMLSRISSVSKQTAAVQAQTSALAREEANLELRVNEFHNLEQIAARAQQLGMESPDETQIRAVCVE
ncbi:MAG: cell division protein FtsL [Eubacteriales bacterium]|nr:cell division protein FtsL [Eubacteriales bacterium]